MSTGTGEDELLTLLLHAGLLKRFVEWTNFIFILVNMLRKYNTILYSTATISIRNCLLSSQLFLREDNKDKAVWPLEFIPNPTVQRFSVRSLDFCSGPKKLHLMIH